MNLKTNSFSGVNCWNRLVNFSNAFEDFYSFASSSWGGGHRSEVWTKTFGQGITLSFLFNEKMISFHWNGRI